MSNAVYDGLKCYRLICVSLRVFRQRSVIDILKKELNFSQLREVHHFIVLIPCLYILLTCLCVFAPQCFIPSFDSVILCLLSALFFLSVLGYLSLIRPSFVLSLSLINAHKDEVNCNSF